MTFGCSSFSVSGSSSIQLWAFMSISSSSSGSGMKLSSPPRTTERQRPSSTPQRLLWTICVSCAAACPEPAGP
ncbi:MAG: hypothetical protein ACLUEK_09925 [Oscillospiraceae bacterium]